MKPPTRVKNTLLLVLCVPVCLFMCSLGSAKKCLSSTVPSAVTMATPTGFSSCAALKNVGLTYCLSNEGSWPTMQQCSQGFAEAVWSWFNSFSSAALRCSFYRTVPVLEGFLEPRFGLSNHLSQQTNTHTHTHHLVLFHLKFIEQKCIIN